MHTLPWIGNRARVGAAVMTVTGARTAASALVAGRQREAAIAVCDADDVSVCPVGQAAARATPPPASPAIASLSPTDASTQPAAPAGSASARSCGEERESLGRARAEMVRQHLADLGIDGAGPCVVGRSDRDPLADDGTESGCPPNPRIETRLKEAR